MSTKHGIGFAIGMVIVAFLAIKAGPRLTDTLTGGSHNIDTQTSALGENVYSYRQALLGMLHQGKQHNYG